MGKKSIKQCTDEIMHEMESLVNSSKKLHAAKEFVEEIEGFAQDLARNNLGEKAAVKLEKLFSSRVIDQCRRVFSIRFFDSKVDSKASAKNFLLNFKGKQYIKPTIVDWFKRWIETTSFEVVLADTSDGSDTEATSSSEQDDDDSEDEDGATSAGPKDRPNKHKTNVSINQGMPYKRMRTE